MVASPSSTVPLSRGSRPIGRGRGKGRVDESGSGTESDGRIDDTGSDTDSEGRADDTGSGNGNMAETTALESMAVTRQELWLSIILGKAT